MPKNTITKKDSFTTIHNKLINDSNLSLKAKGIMLYMLSKPENWKYNPKEIAKNSKDGLDSVYSGLKELIEAGYISRIRYSDGTVDYFVFEDTEDNDIVDFSKKENSEDEETNPNRENPNRENPNRENPNRENPNRENPDVYKRKNSNKERNVIKTDYNKESMIEKNELREACNEIQKKWISIASDFGLSGKHLKINDKRKKAIKTLLNEYTKEEILEAIDKIHVSKFLRGENKNSWQVSFDWLTNKSNLLKVLEGNYDDKTERHSNSYGNSSKDNSDFIVTEESLAETFGRYKL